MEWRPSPRSPSKTPGRRRPYPTEPAILKETITALLADGRVKAIKVGMLANQANAEV